MTDEGKNYCSQLEARGNIIRALQHINMIARINEQRIIKEIIIQGLKK